MTIRIVRSWFAVVALIATLAFPGGSIAQTSPTITPGYLLVIGKTTDRAKIGAYASALPPIYAANNAYYLAIGGAGRGVTWLEGPWQDRSIIFGKFPSRAGVDGFWWGDAYREAIKKRANAGVFSVVALEGTSALQFEGVGTGFLFVMTASRDAGPGALALSAQAAAMLRRGVEASGGQMLISNAPADFTAMEGDSVFDHYAIAAWPTLAARDAYLVSSAARNTARLRHRLGLSVVASANGVTRTQAPPAAAPQN